MERKWDVQWCWNGWLSLGFHIDHTDPGITIHLPLIMFAIGRLKQPGFRGPEERTVNKHYRDKNKWGGRCCWNGWLSLGIHIDHLDPSITFHTPIIIFSAGKLKHPETHKFNYRTQQVERKSNDKGCSL